MPTISMLPIFIREILGEHEFPREPEPDLVMSDEDQVAAYEQGGRNEGVMQAAYLFHAARISQAIKGCTHVLDLGCGPASQLAMVAGLNPDISFTGVDFSETMIASATAYVHDQKLENVQFLRGDITRLDMIPDASFDGVISTMALHHLPTRNHLDATFKEIKRILKPGGSVYLVDFGRLKSLKSVIYFAYMNRAHQPHIFSLDYERSLRAAFLLDEYRELQKAYLPGCELSSTFLIPLLVIIKSEDHALAAQQVHWLAEKRRHLPKKYRKILDDMGLLFRLGGLKNNPFNGC